MITSRRIILLAMLVAVVGLMACRPGAVEPSAVDAPAVEVLIFPAATEKRLVSTDDIPLNNCNGSSEVTQEVRREHVVLRTLELGTELTIDAGGRAGISGIGEVGLGAAVASHYQVSYGSQDVVVRAANVGAKEGTNILHTVREYEIWETGEMLVAPGNANLRIPYSFRRDFDIEILPPANLGCPGQAVTPIDAGTSSQPTATSALTLPPADTPALSATATLPSIEQLQCIHPETLAAQMGWEGRGIVDVYGGYEVLLSANSELPSLWEANGEKRIRQLDPDRMMTAGVWTIYTPYACRDEFDFAK